MVNNFRACGNNHAKLVHAMCREAGIKIWVHILWGWHPKNLGGRKNVQNSARFRTTFVFDCEYLWNGSSNQQAKNGFINHDP